MKRIVITLGTFLAFGLVAAQQDAGMTYGTFDADASGGITAEEFATGFGTDHFTSFDADASGALDQNEFTQGLFDRFDMNDDQALAQDEFDTGTNTLWGDEYAGATFGDLDADASGDVTQEEFTTGFDASSAYGEFDADTNDEVSQEEFTQGLYGTFDADADASLSEEEFGGFATMFGNDATMDAPATDGTTDDGTTDEDEAGEGEAEGN